MLNALVTIGCVYLGLAALFVPLLVITDGVGDCSNDLVEGEVTPDL